MNGILVILAAGGAVVLAALAVRIGRRMQPLSRGLKPYFHRLGTFSPADPCPCHKRNGPAASYAECCRPRDVALLEQQVREFVWNHWSKRTGGRSQARSMSMRLKDFPLPKLTIPEWVEAPERFTFPIPDETLRGWSPIIVDEADPTSTGTGVHSIPL